MHRGLPEGNTKLVLIFVRPWALPTIGPGLRLLQQSFHLLEISAKHRLMGQLHTACFPSTRVPLAYLNEVQRCICMNA